MEPKSAFDGLAAGLRSQAAVRLIPFGLINQFKMAAKDFARRSVSGVARSSWIKPSLILFTAGLCCLPLRGAADTNSSEFENATTAAGVHSMGYKPKNRQGTSGTLPETCVHPGCRWYKCSKIRHCKFGQWSENSGGPNTTSTRLIRNVLQVLFYRRRVRFYRGPDCPKIRPPGSR